MNDKDRESGDPAVARIRGRYPQYTRRRLQGFAERLQQKIHADRVPVTSLALAGPTERISLEDALKLDYRPAPLGETLGPLWATYWVHVMAEVPQAWAGSRVDLYWDSRSEALLWLNGCSSQGLNPGRHTAPLVQSASGGETISFHVEVACNGLFGAFWSDPQAYALVACELRRFDPEASAFYFDYEVLRQLEADRDPTTKPRSYGAVGETAQPALDRTWAGRLLHDLNRICNITDPDDRATWPAARAILDGLLAARNGSITHEMSAIGHAHLDTAWLWPLVETRRKAQRSFSTAVALMERYPDFKFACSQAYQYAVIEQNDPDLFARIRAKAAAGQWIPVGGSWIEPDCNLPWGESICRQFLYGQRYFEQTFGARSSVFWNPDVFGYDAQLPQLMQQAGMSRFLTQKLSWNKFTSPPHHSFHWRGLDGSTVLAHFPPADTYNGSAQVAELRYHAANYKDADRSSDALYLFGYGDGGGGADETMLETLQRARDLQGLPRIQIRSVDEFFDRLAISTPDLATIEGELYLEYHRGTYTTQAETKRLNRACEAGLQALEFVTTVAAACRQPAPSAQEIEALWRTLLVNQFHDIIPGSSIREVYERAEVELAGVAEEAGRRTQAVLETLCDPEDGTWTAINTLGCARAEVASDPDGELRHIVAAPFAAGETTTTDDRVVVAADADGFVLSNARLEARTDRSGLVRSLLHVASGRETFASPAARLLLLDDRPLDFEAWDIDPFALETAREVAGEVSCAVLSDGGLRGEVRFERGLGRASRLAQVIRLDAGADHLEFETTVDWQERKTALKVMFPVACRASNATYETMFGATERPTHANTDADAAKYEVPGHRWADLAEPDFGVSLFSDCRHGYSAFGSQLALTLLRGSELPDPQADIRRHRMRYAIYPHHGDWRRADTVGRALRFERPVLWTKGKPRAPLRHSLLTASPANVIVDTIKPAEDGDGWVVRLYESAGIRAAATLDFGVDIASVWMSNTLEDRIEALATEGRRYRLALRPFQIATLRIFQA
ncbi:alpha-mannosidase [Bradyrhizobium japonicum]|uniref:Alpha-mannosidase n=5 Tax=Bradyrhizobium elkanii TaxID=29448 RepID=A0ABV4F6U8_BRAEL|nr:glycoside hydrolase family 38 C-terminal domain-containing protein [Bradyrhizobium elkanii]MCP1733178.1 alpha-mannosidase [Bradyrhizobium elkanii]MCP1750761.1 alpha-mannosidase [Bradyrhizobium elkanii]MCP1976535.1 alpha-mannosidase [Bradyrhizobium elkanii]MCS3568516.1 alpha-mannosidase [Bradyrhizobium elkanii]MCS3590000.1 alpha-mannosidase [Bradyrhizobium elkanii]